MSFQSAKLFHFLLCTLYKDNFTLNYKYICLNHVNNYIRLSKHFGIIDFNLAHSHEKQKPGIRLMCNGSAFIEKNLLKVNV